MTAPLPVERRQLGRLMVEAGLLTEEQLEAALARQATTGEPLGHVVVELGFTSAAAVANALATQEGRALKTEFGFALGLAPAGSSDSTAPPQMPPVSIRLPTSRPEAPPPQPDPPPREAPAPDRPELDLEAQAEALDRRADELVAAARRIAQLEVQCSRLEAELAATREQVPDPGRIEELQTELGRLRRENGTLRDHLSTAQTERDAAVARADDHEAHVGRLEAELVAVRKQAIDPAEVEIARIELGRARHENQKLREELAAAQAPARHRSHDSHSLLLPAEDGYRQLYRSGPAPEPGEQVELPGRDGSGSRILTVVRTATGPSGTTCAYLAEL